MRIATWSVWGIEARLPLVRCWLRARRPDVVALQKTFVSDDDFPADELAELGYRSVSYGITESRGDFGVAILSRDDCPEPTEAVRGLDCPEVSGARFLSVRIGSRYVASLYAPYLGKLKKVEAIRRRIVWLQRLRGHIERYAGPDSLLCGDFNVKADGLPKPNRGRYSEDERTELKRFCDLGFIDLYRRAHPEVDEAVDFNSGFKKVKKNGTSRLHLVLARGLGARRPKAWVDRDYRMEAAPVIVDLPGVRC